MGNCKDCKHWGEHFGDNQGTCLLTVSAIRATAQTPIKHDFWGTSGLFSNDKLAVMTTPDFGCVNFEKRDW